MISSLRKSQRWVLEDTMDLITCSPDHSNTEVANGIRDLVTADVPKDVRLNERVEQKEEISLFTCTHRPVTIRDAVETPRTIIYAFCCLR